MKKINLILVGVIIVIFQFVLNQLLMINMAFHMVNMGTHEMEFEMNGDFSQNVRALVVPTKMPFYGKDLGLDFSSLENINASIGKMGVLAPMQGSNALKLSDKELKRYVKIGTEDLITCEFCCGVRTLVREDGTPTCGCAHSIAMRGVLAYMIRNYPQMSDKEMSYEIVRQKGMYFPVQMQERVSKQLAGDIKNFTPDVRYLTQNLQADDLNELRKIAKKSGFKPENAPDMVGGC